MKMEEALDSAGLKAHQEDIGRRIKSLRKQRGLTLAKLAQHTGLSIPLLSQIESGRVNLSIANLWKISQALGVEIGHFFQPPGLGEEFELMRAAERQGVAPSHAMPEYLGYAYKFLTSLHPKQTVAIFTVEIEALSEQEVQFNAHAGMEFTFVLRGTIEFLSQAKGGYRVTLSPEDSLRFPSEYPHAYRSLKGTGKVLTMLYAPGHQMLGNGVVP
jgi:transcriptional regulator with XRE-family HTH domain